MPHENAAMGMAHGYYLATGKAQAVMAHTNVGLANCAIGAINAATEHVPVVLMSGRTPVMEKGRLGARTVPIGWGQEMRDQGAMVREATKWEYELKFPEQVPDVVDRAYAIASSVPKGPVYVSLPREVLCEPCPGDAIDGPLRQQPVQIAPPQASVETAADILAKAKNPVIIAQRGTGTAEAFGRFADLVDQWGIPVVQYGAVDPMSKGYVSRCLSEAIASRPATVFSELGCPLEPLSLSAHSSWFQEPHSGGLGWSFPASMGYQLADKDRLVVATMGDGSYMFANPTACHQIAEALELPILILVLNNNEWGAVRQSVTGIYPDGYASKTNEMPLTALKPSPDFTKVAEASRAWVAKAKRAEDLPGILRDAIKHIDTHRTHALVEVTIAP